jgi:two-component system nitrogen regulation sensor histidine kinase GlnL
MPKLDSLALDNLTTAVLLLDEELRLRYLNTATEEMLEKSARRILGRRIQNVCKSESLVEFLRTLRAERQPMTKLDMPLKLPSGATLSVSVNAKPIEDAEHFFILLEIAPMDRHMNLHLSEQHQLQYTATRALIRGLAHEIKNPLGGLRGAAQLLESELESLEQKEYTHIIISEADRLQMLIDRMLGPNQRPHKIVCNVHEIIEHVRKLSAAEAGEGIEIIRDYDPSIPELLLDRGMIVQALLNISLNAIEAMGGRGRLTFSTRILRQHTLHGQRYPLVAGISVTDTGPGIPPHLQPQIFFPMVSGKANGNGLGLSIAQSLIHQHHGVIDFQSSPGGTHFDIQLPILTSHE